tara:strand:+ start:98 stop:868 length:771 start_codon:yes stop_codon:yes gene_type:complete
MKKNLNIIWYNFYYYWAKKFRKILKRFILLIIRIFDIEIQKEKKIIDFYLHEYSSYEEYKKLQVFHNKRKINKVFADEKTLKRVGNIVLKEFKNKNVIKGLCHGSRNGFEQNFLSSLSSKFEVLGTDISETAKDYENSIVWDFHDINNEWIGNNEFIYTNSLDQSWQPKVALQTWLDQLKNDGILIIEHTDSHSPSNASKIDPFGVRPSVMPYVLTMWFGSQISIEHSVDKKENGRKLDAWLFVIKKNVKNVRLLK